jgi:hypothetical protein
VAVIRFEEQMLKSGEYVDCFFGMVMTPSGPRKAKLYGEIFIERLIAKYDPLLHSLILVAGVRAFFQTLAGYRTIVTPKKETIEDPSYYVLPWNLSRAITKSAHKPYQECCIKNGYNAALVHDYITIGVGGYTAEYARKNFPLVKGDPKIGLNHIHDSRLLQRIGIAKSEFAYYEADCWIVRAEHAIAYALEQVPMIPNLAISR